MLKIIKISDSKNRIPASYLSTHEFLSRHISDFSDADLALLIKKSHPVRKLQDKYCYIHAIHSDLKIFTPEQHKKLETAIRNNLKLFQVFYINPMPEHTIQSQMIREAALQQKLLKHMNYLQVILNRHIMISFFLSYSFSRSADFYFKSIQQNAE